MPLRGVYHDFGQDLFPPSESNFDPATFFGRNVHITVRIRYQQRLLVVREVSTL